MLISGHSCFDALIFMIFIIACILDLVTSSHNNDSLKTLKFLVELEFIFPIRKLRTDVAQSVLLALIYVFQHLTPLIE